MPSSTDWHLRCAARKSKPTRRQARRAGEVRLMRIASLIEKIEPFYVMEVAKAASKLAREVADTDRPMIFLNIGEPDFTAPPLVQEAAAKAIRDGVTQYT